jgi:hypothetical protein
LIRGDGFGLLEVWQQKGGDDEVLLEAARLGCVMALAKMAAVLVARNELERARTMVRTWRGRVHEREIVEFLTDRANAHDAAALEMLTALAADSADRRVADYIRSTGDEYICALHRWLLDGSEDPESLVALGRGGDVRALRKALSILPDSDPRVRELSRTGLQMHVCGSWRRELLTGRRNSRQLMHLIARDAEAGDARSIAWMVQNCREIGDEGRATRWVLRAEVAGFNDALLAELHGASTPRRLHHLRAVAFGGAALGDCQVLRELVEAELSAAVPDINSARAWATFAVITRALQ